MDSLTVRDLSHFEQTMGREILLKESTKSVKLKGLKRTLGKLNRQAATPSSELVVGMPIQS